jgi:uncharacterized protein (DUF1800 family)
MAWVALAGFWLSGGLSPISTLAQEAVPPQVSMALTNGRATLKWTLYPGADQFRIFEATNVYSPFQELTDGITNYTWSGAVAPGSVHIYRVEATPMASNALRTAIVLNRLAYGPTPDELERVLTGPSPIGPDAYIAEQLAPETITETVTNAFSGLTNITVKMSAPDEVVPLMILPNYTTTYLTNIVGGVTNITTNVVISSYSYLSGGATFTDWKALFTMHAVGARRQLLEILLQFWENHFVTQFSKSSSYLNGIYNGDNGVMEDRIGAQWEYLEYSKWKAALLRPGCTFHDLLKTSAESPAMIVYLDTVSSRGDGTRIANENYARELLELFTFGVDNGYDQNDIVSISKCWTGWTVAKVDATNAFNPFATGFSGTGYGTNTVGVWAFNYKSTWHNTNSKSIFTGKTVPDRFGAPYVTRLYGTNTTPGLYQVVIPARTGTNGLQDGYEVIRYLADLPFTQEYLSVKLCRLFVHEDFATGYDFTDPNLSPEGQLVRQCMAAWDNASPRGQIRPVLATIFNSPLFNGSGAARHKVKTPLEFVVSSVRALRASTNNTGLAGSFSASTDGYAFNSPLSRMGSMFLFDRADPDGYPEHGTAWISAGTLAERLRFVQSLCIANGQSGHSGSSDAGNNVCDPVNLLRFKLPLQNPPGSLNNATNVTDYFLSLLFPGEGKANLAVYRDYGVRFLNDGTADSTANATPFASLAVSNVANSSYDNRVRGLVGMLMTLARFQEQ